MAADRSGDSSGDTGAVPDSDLAVAAELIELERARLGHEIHDTLLPLIFAASASVHRLADQGNESADSASPSGPATESLRQVALWLDDALQIGRKLLVEVYPPELEQRDWTAAVDDTLKRLHPGECTFQWRVDPALNDQPASIRTAAYRIAIEAARNALRHGNALNIEFTAQHQGNIWTLEVTDDGRGFEVAQVPADRFGIRSMLGRAKLVGGSGSITSQPGGPTRVTFTWPSRQDNAR